jgi:hypothetical protein
MHERRRNAFKEVVHLTERYHLGLRKCRQENNIEMLLREYDINMCSEFKLHADFRGDKAALSQGTTTTDSKEQ